MHLPEQRKERESHTERNGSRRECAERRAVGGGRPGVRESRLHKGKERHRQVVVVAACEVVVAPLVWRLPPPCRLTSGRGGRWLARERRSLVIRPQHRDGLSCVSHLQDWLFGTCRSGKTLDELGRWPAPIVVLCRTFSSTRATVHRLGSNYEFISMLRMIRVPSLQLSIYGSREVNNNQALFLRWVPSHSRELLHSTDTAEIPFADSSCASCSP